MQNCTAQSKKSLYKRLLDSFQKQLQIPLANEAVGIAQPLDTVHNFAFVQNTAFIRQQQNTYRASDAESQ